MFQPKDIVCAELTIVGVLAIVGYAVFEFVSALFS